MPQMDCGPIRLTEPGRTANPAPTDTYPLPGNAGKRKSAATMQGSRAYSARTALHRCHRAAILLYTSHRNPKKRQGGRYHQPNPLNPIHLRLYLSSAQAILHHAVHLHARFLHHGEIHRFHLNHHQRTGNVSMEQKTIPDAMDQTAPGIRGQYL